MRGPGRSTRSVAATYAREPAGPIRLLVAGVAARLGGVALPFLALLATLALTATAQAAQPPVTLGTAGSFAVLAGTTVTNTGLSDITGDLGVSPGTALTGFSPDMVLGTLHAADPVARQAQADLTSAYQDAAGRTPATGVSADLGGQTLTPGVYRSASALGLTGTLTLDALGDPNAVFMFQAGSTLITAPGSVVNLIGGAQACNVFWQVGSSAALGTTSVFKGSILALTSVTVTTGTRVDGRVLARNGAVTLDNDTITRAQCALPPPPQPVLQAVLGLPTAGLTLRSASPAGGLPGALISLTGDFGAGPEQVLVRGVSAAIVSASSSRVTIVMPNLTPGPADVTLILGGRRLTAPGLLEVGRAPNQPPVANLLALPTSNGLTFLFDATLSIDPEGLGGPLGGKAENGLAAGLRSVLWRFGDGGQATQPVVRHTYRSPGDYRVTLRVTDGAGVSSTTVQTVTAEAGGRPTFRPVNIRIPSQIVFDFGASALRPTSRAYLMRVAKVVRRAGSRTRVAGYTDAVGPAAFNQRLSLKRALTVRGFLARRGQVAAREMFARGFGERRPLASNATELGRQKNRRVVLTFRLGTRAFARI